MKVTPFGKGVAGNENLSQTFRHYQLTKKY